ncbi:MAG: hypothetical protein JO166_22875 [Deltaproteobacteria bacterium]|nr:hypothetical protein [Deltaproteobacteria bacterium]
MLERMRERLHHGRDAHQPKRPEPHPGTISQHEAVSARRETQAPTTPKTGPIIPEALHPEATNSRKPAAENSALSNGSPSPPESGTAENGEQGDDASRPGKPV